MAVLLEKPALSEVQALFRAECCNCGYELTTSASGPNGMTNLLNHWGWRKVTTEDEINPMACPACVEALIKIDELDSGDACDE